MTADQQQPIACTLSGEARQDRRAWIDALARDALRGIERDDLTLRLRFAPEAIPRIQDMVRKEQACCGFLTFEMEERPQELWLIIRAPEAARAAADVLFAQFTGSAGSPCGKRSRQHHSGIGAGPREADAITVERSEESGKSLLISPFDTTD